MLVEKREITCVRLGIFCSNVERFDCHCRIPCHSRKKPGVGIFEEHAIRIARLLKELSVKIGFIGYFKQVIFFLSVAHADTNNVFSVSFGCF
jgi:hypothetical protein